MFMVTLGVGIYNPLVPLYAKILGATYFDLGLIGMVFALPYAVFPIFVGSLTDRFGRNPFFVFGVLLTSFSTFLFTLATKVMDIVLIRIIGGIAYSFLWPVAEAIITDVTPTEKRTKILGRFSFFWALGFLVGPFFGGIIVEKFGFYILFMIALTVGLTAGVIASYGFIRKGKGYRKTPIKIFGIKNYRKFGFKKFLPLYLVILVYSIVIGLIFSIFPVYANSFGVTSFYVGILFTIFGVARTVTFLQSGNLSKIFNEKMVVILGLIILSISLALMGFIKTLPFFALSIALIGLATGMLSPVTVSLASKMAEKERVGVTLGFTEACFGLGMTIGPITGGLMAEILGVESPYLVISLLSFMTSMFLVGKKYFGNL